MGGHRRKKREDPHNKRLDLFLSELEIEKEKRDKIIEHVENITFKALKERSKPRLRLNKPN